MASDPVIRKQVLEVLEALEDKQHVSADTMEQLRAKLGLKCSLSKLRRAICSLHYGRGGARLTRPTLGEGLGRGWRISYR